MIRNYNKDYCYQYHIRLSNLNDDIKRSGLSINDIDNLKVSNFIFTGYELSKDKSMFHKAKKFIERHEWLGTLSNYPTHLFTATYKDILCGVVFHDMPVAFSNILGKETKKLERLISRGACISFSPKCLGSALVMYSIRWSVKNTQYRVFTAYSDPEAKELGTIYQACNFLYLGNKFGAKVQYKSPVTGKWVSDRSFRTRSAYKRYAKALNIEWQDDWSKGDKVYWNNIPDDIEMKLRDYSKYIMTTCEKRELTPKHKYVYILGKNKRETKALRSRLKVKTYPYPKNRGS